jgi:hypothetical protein
MKIIKQILFGRGVGFRTIKVGIAKGIKMKIDPLNKSQRILGLDEFEIHRYFKKFSQQYNTFIDIGSSDGYYSLIYRKYNKTGKIFSCEADADLETEQIENFKVNNFPVDSLFSFTSGYIGDIDTRDTICIDSLIKHEPLKNVFFKIDIEGAEAKALKGALGCLKSYECALIIETHNLPVEQECIVFLEEAGYRCKIINNSGFRTLLPETRLIDHNRWLICEKQSIEKA